MTYLKEILLGLLLAAGSIFLAFFSGRKAGSDDVRERMEEQKEADAVKREAAAAKKMLDAMQGRQQVEDEITKKGPSNARKELGDSWTRD